MVSVDFDGKTQTFSLPAAPATQDFGPAAQAAAEATGPDARVVIRADARVPHGVVIALIDALKQRGITHIAFGVAPSP